MVSVKELSIMKKYRTIRKIDKDDLEIIKELFLNGSVSMGMGLAELTSAGLDALEALSS